MTKAVGIVGFWDFGVRLFCHGQIIPERWMMDHAAHLRGIVKWEQSQRIDGADAKSATSLYREVRATNYCYNGTNP